MNQPLVISALCVLCSHSALAAQPLTPPSPSIYAFEVKGNPIITRHENLVMVNNQLRVEDYTTHTLTMAQSDTPITQVVTRGYDFVATSVPPSTLKVTFRFHDIPVMEEDDQTPKTMTIHQQVDTFSRTIELDTHDTFCQKVTTLSHPLEWCLTKMN